MIGHRDETPVNLGGSAQRSFILARKSLINCSRNDSWQALCQELMEFQASEQINVAEVERNENHPNQSSDKQLNGVKLFRQSSKRSTRVHSSFGLVASLIFELKITFELTLLKLES